MTPSRVWRTVGVAIVVALAQVGCGAGSGPSGSLPSEAAQATPTTSNSLPSEAARTPSAECINPPQDLLTLINQTDPVACYGDAPITIEAEVVPIGAIDCPALEPAWLNCGAFLGLAPIAAQAGRTPGFVLAKTTGLPGQPPLEAVIDPQTGVAADDILNRQLRITGHFDDPAAQTCHETELASGEPGDPPELIIAACRSLFVMTGFEPL